MKRDFLLITFVIALVVGLLINTVNAASIIATMTTSKTTVAESSEFLVTIKVSNIDAGTNGINSISGIFSYDTKVFESITGSSLAGSNNWTPNYFPDTGKIILMKPSFTKSDEDVLQITLKTKANTAGKSGVISFKNIEASNSETDIQAADISTTITVGNAGTSQNEGNSSTPQVITPNIGNSANTNTNTNTNSSVVIGTNTNTNSNTNTNTNTSSNIVTSSTVNKVQNVSNNTVTQTESDIPYTGVSNNIMKAIFVVLVIAGVFYFKYESIKEN